MSPGYSLFNYQHFTKPTAFFVCVQPTQALLLLLLLLLLVLSYKFFISIITNNFGLALVFGKTCSSD